MSGFLTGLHLEELGDEEWKVIDPLIYKSDLLNAVVKVPVGFHTDLSTVKLFGKRIPVIFTLWGARQHREAVLHDYLYCSDSAPVVTRKQADGVFFEAATVRGKKWSIRFPMWLGVRIGGWACFHKRTVSEHLGKA